MKTNKFLPLFFCLFISILAVSQTKGIEEKEYYKNGQLQSIGKYIDEIETGEWKYYHENGKLKSIGKYIEGNEAGEWKFYDETGKLVETIKFFDGKLSDNIPPIQKYLDKVVSLELYEDEPTKVSQKISITTFISTSDTKGFVNYKKVYSNIDWSEFNKYKYNVYKDFVVIEFIFHNEIKYQYSDNESKNKNEEVYSFSCQIWPKDEAEVLEILKDWKDKRDGNY
ncbi:hypothetical protein FLGE108171_09700 [Flavobacterium gelidilacus]|jgi:hypothetical protein|uniref:toxin-antitoxin system YwqK family antitoxin n=1 Tax=Flavobacterium gelidilacus TaxID=206041 RepID=UPI00040462BF|nr:hypothetical protein [Flavobacterium gelidilacus]